METDIDKAIELGQVLHQQVDYSEDRVTELVIEEFRFFCLDCTRFLEGCFWPAHSDRVAHAIKAANILYAYYQVERIDKAIKEVYRLSDSQMEEVIAVREGYMTIYTRINNLRANDFGFEYRCYIGLEDLGGGKSAWGYIIPDTVEANITLDFALKALVSKKEVYVYGKMDGDLKKLKILELGFK